MAAPRKKYHSALVWDFDGVINNLDGVGDRVTQAELQEEKKEIKEETPKQKETRKELAKAKAKATIDPVDPILLRIVIRTLEHFGVYSIIGSQRILLDTDSEEDPTVLIAWQTLFEGLDEIFGKDRSYFKKAEIEAINRKVNQEKKEEEDHVAKGGHTKVPLIDKLHQNTEAIQHLPKDRIGHIDDGSQYQLSTEEAGHPFFYIQMSTDRSDPYKDFPAHLTEALIAMTGRSKDQIIARIKVEAGAEIKAGQTKPEVQKKVNALVQSIDNHELHKLQKELQLLKFVLPKSTVDLRGDIELIDGQSNQYAINAQILEQDFTWEGVNVKFKKSTQSYSIDQTAKEQIQALAAIQHLLTMIDEQIQKMQQGHNDDLAQWLRQFNAEYQRIQNFIKISSLAETPKVHEARHQLKKCKWVIADIQNRVEQNKVVSAHQVIAQIKDKLNKNPPNFEAAKIIKNKNKKILTNENNAPYYAEFISFAKEIPKIESAAGNREGGSIFAGMLSGAGAGSVIGSFIFPVIGTGIGLVVGMIIGGILGKTGGKLWKRKYVRDTIKERDQLSSIQSLKSLPSTDAIVAASLASNSPKPRKVSISTSLTPIPDVAETSHSDQVPSSDTEISVSEAERDHNEKSSERLSSSPK